jgi:integrase
MGFSAKYYLNNVVTAKQITKAKELGDKNLLETLKKRIGEEQQIYLYVRLPRVKKPIKVYTGRKCKQDEWDFKEKRVKFNVYKKGATEFNQFLSQIQTDVEKLYGTKQNQKARLLKEDVKRIIDQANNVPEEVEEIPLDNFENFVSAHIEDSKSRVKQSTLDVYEDTLNHLLTFSRLKKVDIEFQNIDLDFYYSFLTYLTKELKQSLNTVGKYIRVFKAFLTEAEERGIKVHPAHNSKKFKAPAEETDSIFLSEEEIGQMYSLDLSKNPRLEKARDLFVAGCFLGVRFSDLTEITQENIHLEGDMLYVKIRTIKTSKEVFIPLYETVKNIFQKYNGALPNNISNQKMNKYIKEVGSLAGISGAITIFKTLGNERVSFNHLKFQLISTHTARRSFATNAYLRGAPIYTIMQITGHKTEKAFRRYIKVSALQHAQLLNKIWKPAEAFKVLTA